MEQTILNLSKSPIRDAVSRVRFAPHSDNLLISSWDSSLRLYDVDKDELRLSSSSGQEGAALLDCCFQNESVAFSAASDGAICRYDLESEVDCRIGTHDEIATCVEYSHETNLVVTGGWDKKIRFWDTSSSSVVGCLDNICMEVESMSLSGFFLMVAVGSSVSTYDLRNIDKSVQPNDSFVDIRIKCVRPILGCEGFAVGSIDGRVALRYTSDTQRRGYAFRCHPMEKVGKLHLATVNDIAFYPSMPTVFATGDNDGYASLWDSQSKKRIYELPRFPSAVASLSYNHSGQLLAVASSYTYQEDNEREEPPQIYMHETNHFPVEVEGSISPWKKK